MVAFNLEKEEKKVKFVLEKKQIANITAMVSLVLDISGSMKNNYERGIVQEFFQRTLPVALNFDDNGELDVFVFSSGKMHAQISPSATRANYDSYVQKEILNNRGIEKWGGTDYAPVTEALLKEYGFLTKKGGFFGMGGQEVLQASSKKGFPAICYFITDGENSDQTETYQLLKKCQEAHSNIYFLFIGIGREAFRFLKRVADDFDNTGFLAIEDLGKSASDEAFHESLLPDELCTWLGGKKG